MDEVKTFLQDKKNLATLAFLTLMVTILPVGIALIRSQQVFFSKASGDRIQVGTGRCVIERDGKKVLICNEVPISLNAPFDPKVTPTPTPTPTPVVTPSPSPAADAGLKYTAGLMSKLPSKIGGLMSNIEDKLIPPALSYDKHMCAGDTTAGVGGLIDIVVNGCGEALNYDSIYHSCVAGATVQYKAPVWNATKHEWETIKQDGTVISQAQMIQKSQSDGRFPIALSSTDNPPWINCEVYFEYSGRNDCDVTPQKNAAGQSMGREGTEIDSGQQITLGVAKTANPATGDPDCKQQVQVELKTAATPSPTASASPVTTASPSPTPVPTPTSSPGQCTAGLFASAQMEGPAGCGTITPLLNTGAPQGVLVYTAPNATSDVVCTMKVQTSNNGDCKLDSSGKGTAANPLKPNESMNITYSNACVDNSAGCSQQIIISSLAPLPTTQSSYKLAETEAGLATSTERGLPSQQFTTTYNLTDSKPGMKQIWVEFNDKVTGTKTKDFMTIELVENNPVIKQTSCQLDIAKSAVNFTITGLRFGADSATATANGSALDVTSWNATEIKGALKNANFASGDQIYKVKITRKDNVSSEEIQCRLGIAQISLGTQLLCRGEGKLDLSNVTLNVIDENNNKTEETASITKDGIISNLKTKFEIGKNYSISIKAPKILRRNISFKAVEGTTVITKDDGTKLQLPVGDIFPNSTSGDGQINTLDQSELMRQWRNVEGGNTALTADFNSDTRVNAFDWSCMRQSFGASNDSLPGAPSGGNIGTSFSEGGPGTITVQFGTPSSGSESQPKSTESSSSANEPKILIEGKTH